jgi:hypothetical protein
MTSTYRLVSPDGASAFAPARLDILSPTVPDAGGRLTALCSPDSLAS